MYVGQIKHLSSSFETAAVSLLFEVASLKTEVLDT